MTRNLTTGSPMRLILQFAVPTLLGLLFQQCYNLVDTMIVGKLLGAQALAAVGSTVLSTLASSAFAPACAAGLPFQWRSRWGLVRFPRCGGMLPTRPTSPPCLPWC